MWLNTLRTSIETHIGTDATLLIAVSGGGDSVALLRGCVYWQAELRLRVVVAHLDHGLRPDSAEDAAFVGQLTQELKVMCLRERQDVAGWATQQGRNLEDAARHLRYTMLESAAQAVGAKAVVVAHSADDQAETLLMHLFRGAGLDGLTGMSPLGRSPIPAATVPIFRPLLEVTRAELRTWLTDNGYGWREDSTNADTSRLRSATRHRLLPFLEESFPNLREKLGHTATLLAADAELLHEFTDKFWKTRTQVYEKRVCFYYADFVKEPIAIQRRLIRRAYRVVQTELHELTYKHITNALDIAARGKMNSRATLPGGVFLTLAHDGLWVEIPQQPKHFDPIELPTEGTIQIGHNLVKVDAIKVEQLPDTWGDVSPFEAYFDSDTITFPLTLRTPRPNDYWEPYGMKGQSVNLRDWMAKQKIPLSLRNTKGLIVDAKNRVLWVIGLRTSHVGCTTEHTRNVVRIAYSVNDDA